MEGIAVQAQPQIKTRPGVKSGGAGDELRRLLHLHVPVIVKLAERRMRLSRIVSLATGTIVEFDKPAEQPLELMVNNVTIGQGDVVKIGENFGLRINSIGRPEQTIRALVGG